MKFLIIITSFFAINLVYSRSLKAGLDEKKQDVKFKSKKIKLKKDLNPKKAFLYSAIFPGLGQLYSRKYWKVPIFAGLFINTLNYYIFYNKQYGIFTNIYNDRQKGIYTDKYTKAGGAAADFSNSTIKSGIDFYAKNRDTMVAYMIGIYLLNLLDAFVAANMYGYNVDDDLSFLPYVDAQQSSIGMSVNIKL